MKDRYKIFWACVSIAAVLALVIGTLTASFKRVQLRQYGLLYYTMFNRLTAEDARQNGNYLVGLDYGFHTFPRGVLSLPFRTSVMTRDMSLVEIEGLFLGRLIPAEVLSMYTNFGMEYSQFLRASVEELTRRAIEGYTLTELIGSRVAVENNVRGLVCLELQNMYAWVQCDSVSLGRVGANVPQPDIIALDDGYEAVLLGLLQREIEAQRRVNVYVSGGGQLLRELALLDEQLFLNVSRLMADSLAAGAAVNQSEVAAKARYYLQSAQFPTMNNQLNFRL